MVLLDAARPSAAVFCWPKRGQGHLFRELARRNLLSVEHYDGSRPIYRLTLHGKGVAAAAEAYRREMGGAK